MQASDETITWLTYNLDLGQAPSEFWALLGRIDGSIELLEAVPVTGAEARSLERDVRAMGLRARLAQDGIFVRSDVLESLLSGRSQPEVDDRTRKAIDDLQHAWHLIRTDGSGPPADLTVAHIRDLHSACSPDQPDARNWRRTPAPSIRDGVPPEMIELFLEELLEWLPHLEKAVDLPNNRSSKAVVRSVIAELYLHWIRPCDQGNARLSGSFWAHALHRSGLPEALGHIASDHYLRHFADLQRIAHAAADPSADPMPFLLFSLRGIADGLQDLHRRIRGLQFNGQWRAQLLDLFREANDAPTRRQRQLLLDLGENDAAVHLPRLPLLTPELAALYAGVSEKTLRRDVDALLAAGVLLRTAEGLHVDRSSILAFKGRAPIPDDPGSDRPL